MYTQVAYAELVDNLLAKIGEPLGIKFVQPSVATMQSYENGKWLYAIHGIAVEVFRWGRGRDVWSQEGYIPGYQWSDERERRLNRD